MPSTRAQDLTQAPRLTAALSGDLAAEVACTLAASCPDCVSVISVEGEVLFMNERALRAMGVADTGFTRGERWVTLWPEGERAQVELALSMCARGESTNFVAELPGVDGVRTLWDVWLSPVGSDDAEAPRALLVVSRNAAQRHDAKRFEAIFEHAPVMVAGFFGKDCVNWNAECVKQLGYTLDDLQAASDPFDLFYRDRDASERMHRSVLDADGEFRAYELIAKDGAVRHHEWANFSLPTGETISIGIDLTELRTREEELTVANGELQEFASVAAHDLQSPLRALASYAMLLQADLKGSLSEVQERYLDRISLAAIRMRMLVQDLMTLAAMDRDRAETEDVDLAALMSELAHDFEVQIEGADGRLVIGELPTIDGVRSQLGQLLDNLVSNAFRFRGSEPPVVQVRSVRTHEGWAIEVEDNGVGVPEKYREQIFRPFHRLDRTTSEQGTGIGLSICARVAARHGGRIEVRTAEPRGTIFAAHFPFIRKD